MNKASETRITPTFWAFSNGVRWRATRAENAALIIAVSTPASLSSAKLSPRAQLNHTGGDGDAARLRGASAAAPPAAAAAFPAAAFPAAARPAAAPELASVDGAAVGVQSGAHSVPPSPWPPRAGGGMMQASGRALRRRKRAPALASLYTGVWRLG